MENPNDTFWLLLMACLYMHVLDDFVLQKATLCDLKQKDWWRKLVGPEFEKSRYSHDYVMALFIHAGQCSLGMLLPIALFQLFKGMPVDVLFLWMAFCVNTCVHAFVDNLKANEFAINLIEDQMAHIVQIVVTLVVFIMRNFA